MIRYLLILLLVASIPDYSFAQPGPAYSIFLIGDAGENTWAGPALIKLKSELNSEKYGENSAVIFLGDNIYPCGLVTSEEIGNSKHQPTVIWDQVCCNKINKATSDTNKAKMLSQLDGLQHYKGKWFMVPGNHDWQKGQRNGQLVLNNGRKFVDRFLESNQINGGYYPKRSFGPESELIAIGTVRIRLIFLDTQWWLHAHNSKIDGLKKKSWKGKKEELNSFLDTLKSIVQNSIANKEYVIISAHHPIYTYGIHGIHDPFYFRLAARLWNQHIYSKRNNFLRQKLNTICSLASSDSLFYVAGHDHNLQYFQLKNYVQIVSGAGAKCTKDDCSNYHICNPEKIDGLKEMYGEFNALGFFRIDFYHDSKPVIKIWNTDAGDYVDPNMLRDYMYPLVK